MKSTNKTLRILLITLVALLIIVLAFFSGTLNDQKLAGEPAIAELPPASPEMITPPGDNKTAANSTPVFFGEVNTLLEQLSNDAMIRYVEEHPDTNSFYYTRSIDLPIDSDLSFSYYSGQGQLYLIIDKETILTDFSINGHALKDPEIISLEADSDPNESSVFCLDISPLTVNGTNTIHIAGESGSVHLYLPYPALITGTPEDAGIDSSAFEKIDRMIQTDVSNGFPGASLAVIRNGRLIYSNQWGYLNAYLPDGSHLSNPMPADADTMYDLASNTKMYATNYIVQYLVSRGELDIDTKLVDIFGNDFVIHTMDFAYEDYPYVSSETNQNWKREITLRHLLCHEAGFPAAPGYSNPNFNQYTQEYDEEAENILFAGSDGSVETRQTVLRKIFETPLCYEPGTNTRYSDVDYMLLCFVLEKVTGKGLDELVEEYFTDPLHLKRISYCPLENGFTKEDCAATELNGNTRDGVVYFDGIRTETLQGEVHDEMAYYAMGGISGHAGLFSNAEDLAKMAYLMMYGGYETNYFFSEETIRTFAAAKSTAEPNWGIGWWRAEGGKRSSYFSDLCPSTTIGHQGWTGTLTMIEPEHDLIIVYLTNKINTPVADPENNPNKFTGSSYNSASLGLIPQYIYEGMK